MPDEKNDFKSFYANKPNLVMGNRAGHPHYGGMEGEEVVRLPGLPGSRFDSTDVLVKDIPRHVSVQLERSLADEGFYGAKPHLVLAHLCGALQGAGVFDEKTSARLGRLVDEFSQTPEAEQKQFFHQRIRPFVNSLKRQAR